MASSPKVKSARKENDFSKTYAKVSSWSKENWNQSMSKTFSSMKDCDQKKKLNLNFAVLIAQSVDQSTGQSCLQPDQIKELRQFIDVYHQGEGDTDTIDSGVDNGAVGQATIPDKAVQVPVQEPNGKKSKGASGQSNVGLPKPQASASSPKQKQRSKDQFDSQATVHESNNGRSLADKREQELKEKEEECASLSKRIEKKDKELNELEGKVKNLEAEKSNLNEKLNREIAEKYDRQKVLMGLEKQAQESHAENTKLNTDIDGLRKANKELEANISKVDEAFIELSKEKEKQNKDFQKTMTDVYKKIQKQTDAMKGDHEREVRMLRENISEIVKERDDLKTRFSKLAGAKLTDQNADIADLSDPNRAMKVSEKFGQLYDDEWTDAFEELKKKKVSVKDCIQFLLRILQESLAFCNNLKETQMHSLNNVLLHPSQDVSKFVSAPRTNVGGLKERPRISSKNEKAVRDLRRQIGVSDTCLDEVKQVFVIETRSWDKKGYDKKHLELCMPYIQKCAEICWLMVLHDPPLHMKMDAKNGDKMDSNFYTVYSSSGDKIDFLVWPPLFNEAGGGLITKGVAECLRTVKKK